MSRITVCFFGITRSLRYTQASIEANILEPARNLGDLRVCAHFFKQTQIDNPRSGEAGQLDTEEYQLLSYDNLELEAPDACLEQNGFEALKTFGDEWDDEFRSLRNLVHQLHSLNRVTEAALAEASDVVLFCRPDLLYFDSLGSAIERSLAAPKPLVQLPWWQSWRGGVNDRFAIINGRDAVAAYGKRIEQALPYCTSHQAPLHAERLLADALRDQDVREVGLRASRMRFDGTLKFEEFDHRTTRHNARRIRRRIPGKTLQDPLVRLVCLAQRAVLGDVYSGSVGDVTVLRPNPKELL